MSTDPANPWAPPPSGPARGGPPPPGPPGPAEPWRAGSLGPAEPWRGAPEQARLAWAAGRPLRVPRWGLPSAVATILAALLLPATLALPFVLAPEGQPDGEALTDALPSLTVGVLMVGLLAQWLPMLGLPLLVSVVRGNGPRLDYGLAIGRRDLLPGLLGGLVAVGCALLVGLVTYLVYGDFQSSAEDLVDLLDQGPLVVGGIVLALVVMAPLVEEVCFRGLLWGALRKRGLSPWWATGVSALAFAAMHVEPVRFALLLGTGLILGYLRQRTGRLGPSILAHAVNNAIAAIGLLSAI